MNRITAIKSFFEAADPDAAFAARFPARKVTMQEMKDLTADDRQELGELAAAQLGVAISDK